MTVCKDSLLIRFPSINPKQACGRVRIYVCCTGQEDCDPSYCTKVYLFRFAGGGGVAVGTEGACVAGACAASADVGGCTPGESTPMLSVLPERVTLLPEYCWDFLVFSWK